MENQNFMQWIKILFVLLASAAMSLGQSRGTVQYYTNGLALTPKGIIASNILAGSNITATVDGSGRMTINSTGSTSLTQVTNVANSISLITSNGVLAATTNLVQSATNTVNTNLLQVIANSSNGILVLATNLHGSYVEKTNGTAYGLTNVGTLTVTNIKSGDQPVNVDLGTKHFYVNATDGFTGAGLHLVENIGADGKDFNVISTGYGNGLGAGHFAIYNDTDSRGPYLDIDGAANGNIKLTPNGIGNVLLSGSVGIGTNNPQAKLHVVGDTLVQNGTNAGVQLISSTDSGVIETTMGTTYGGLDLKPADGALSLYRGGSNASFTIWDTTVSTSKISIRASGNTFFNGGNVGIGTNNPQAKLHVAGNEIVDGWIKVGDNNSYFGNAALLSGDAADAAIRAERDLVLGTAGGTERVRILSAGNVGIGTNNPQATLDVNGSAIVRGGLTNLGNVAIGAIVGDDPLFYFSGEASENWLYFNPHQTGGFRWGTAKIQFNGQDDGVQIVPYSPVYVGFSVKGATGQDHDLQQWKDSNGVNLVVVNANGSVGIGTNAPQAKLHVLGDSKFRNTLDGNVINFGAGVYDWGNLGIETASENTIYLANNRITAPIMDFRLGGNDATNTKVRILGDGSVGIGVTNPLVKLHVGSDMMFHAPNANWDLALSRQVSNTWHGIYIGDVDWWCGGVIQHYFNFAEPYYSLLSLGTIGFSGDEHTLNIKNGSVGIGTNAPQAKLHVVGGDVRVSGDIYASSLGDINNAAYYLDPGSNSRLGGNLAVDGSVGIGTNAPQATLDVNGTTRIHNTLEMREIDDGNTSFRVVDGNTQSYLELMYNGLTNITLDPNGPSWFNGGSVGIGTNNPQAKLHVNGGVLIDGGLTNTGNINLNYSRIVGASYLDFWGLAAMNVSDAGPIVMQINPGAGSVGIGTNNPQAKLHVFGNALIEDSAGFGSTLGISGNYPTFSWNQWDENNAFYARTDVRGLRFFSLTNSVVECDPILYMLDTGNVGIGTNNPQAKLHVNGDARFVNGLQTIDVATGSGYAGLSEYYSTEVNPRWRIGRDCTGSSGIGFLNANYDVNSTIDNDGVGVGAALGGTKAMAFYISNGTNLIEKARIDSAGNVGIGTNNPSSKLHVAGDVKAEGDIILDDTATNFKSLKGSSTPSLKYISLESGDGAGIWAGYNGIRFFTDSPSTEKMRIGQNGYVGIGVVPSEKLEVAGNVKASGTIISGSSVGAGSGSAFAWVDKSRLRSPTNGAVSLLNNADDGFTRLIFGANAADSTPPIVPALTVDGSGLKLTGQDGVMYPSNRLATSGLELYNVGLANTNMTPSADSARIFAATNAAGVAQLYAVNEAGEQAELTPHIAWRDCIADVMGLGKGSQAPALVLANPATSPQSPVQGYGFQSGDVVFGNWQLNHDVARTNAQFPNFYVVPHVHFSLTNGEYIVGQTNISWVLDYQWAPIGISFEGSYGSLTNTHSISPDTEDAIAMHRLLEFPAITNNDCSGAISSVISFRLRRLAAAAGDFGTDRVVLRGVDVHYPVNRLGSTQSSSY